MAQERENPGTVYLVGSGPGDADLITVRGYDLLLGCDALVYDSLAPDELVRLCPAEIKVYAGKTAGGHAMKQEEINRVLVELAFRPDGPERIVRLKGGDPYVFGRGGEEALACALAGVPFEVVPGVSAGVAAAAYAGVPVTQREISRGVVLLTGHALGHEVPDLPWLQLATSGLTLVFYMGVKHLPRIVEALLEHGLDPSIPAMVVQEGTTPGQRSVQAPVRDIVERATGAKIRPPAITVIGRVVELAETLGVQRPRPLAGKTIVLLRAEEYHYPELERLRQAGARVLDVTGIRCVARTGDPGVRVMLDELSADHVVLMTSAMAVRFFTELWEARGKDREYPTVVTASPAFLAGLAQKGLDRAFAPPAPGPGRVVKLLREQGVPPGTVIWLPRASTAGQKLPASLREAGYEPRPVAIYDTLPVPLPEDARSLLQSGRADALAFLSSSGVQAALKAVPELAGEAGAQMLFAAVGGKTAATAQSQGLECSVVPEAPSVGTMVDALLDAMQSLDRGAG